MKHTGQDNVKRTQLNTLVFIFNLIALPPVAQPNVITASSKRKSKIRDSILIKINKY